MHNDQLMSGRDGGGRLATSGGRRLTDTRRALRNSCMMSGRLATA